MSNQYEPSGAFFAELSEIHGEYKKAHAEKNFSKSDILRATLIEKGVIDIDASNPKWHPVFESSVSRACRLSQN